MRCSFLRGFHVLNSIEGYITFIGFLKIKPPWMVWDTHLGQRVLGQTYTAASKNTSVQ